MVSIFLPYKCRMGTCEKLDIGLDASLFNQVNITFDYFRDYRDRILMKRASFGKLLGYWGSTPWSNIGEVLNTGFEVSVNWKNNLEKTGKSTSVVTSPIIETNTSFLTNRIIPMYGKRKLTNR